MRYVLTNNEKLFHSKDYNVISLKDALQAVRTWKVIQFDSETTGLNPHINKPWCFQLGNKAANTQLVIDTSTGYLIHFKEVLEHKLIIGHNLKFDLQFLYNYKIIPRYTYDTMIVEQVLNQGVPYQKILRSTYEEEHYTFPILAAKDNPDLVQLSYSLQALTDKYISKHRDKTIRSEITNRGLDNDTIIYACDDVVDLEDIKDAQVQEGKRLNCIPAIKLECQSVQWMAYMEWCGVKLDEYKWKTKMLRDESNMNKSKKALDDFVINHPKLKKFTFIDTQGDLFTGFDLTPKCTVNWDSSKQVIPVAKALGFDTTVQDKATGEDKDSVLEKVLMAQKGVCDEFLTLYFDYQGYAKVVSSFGQVHLDAINPITGRIHTKFQQLGASSGRLSCGGGPDEDLCRYKKLPSGSCKLVNLQQLPHDELTRSCFIAEPGNLWVSCDFSAEEARLTADVSGDEEYYKEFTERTGDTHAMFAWACYEPQCRELGCTSAMDVKKKAKYWRDKVKSAEFAYTFSASAPTIAKTANIPLQQAEKMVNDLNKFFFGLTKFKQEAAEEVKKLGYIIICPETGHRLNWWDHKHWLEVQESFTKDFWNDFKLNHKGTNDSVAQLVRNHFQAADKYSKLGLNSRTQGRGAIIFKESCNKLFSWIVDHNYFNIIKLVVGVHDEINCEFPESLKDTFPQVLQKIMETSAAKYCKTLSIPAEPAVGDHWIH